MNQLNHWGDRQRAAQARRDRWINWIGGISLAIAWLAILRAAWHLI